jgi:hypothetical protein
MQVPASVFDFIEQDVSAGDRVVTTVNIGTKGLEEGTVLGFQWGRDDRHGNTVLKMRIQKTGKTKPSLINADLRRFVKVPHNV